MNKHIKNYLDSFKFKKIFGQIFLVDFMFFSITAIIFSVFSNYLQNRSMILLGGKTAEDLQAILSTSSPEAILPFLTELKSFLTFAVIGIILLVVLAVLYFSFTRALIWNHLRSKKLTRKTYWRWNLLNLSLIFPLLSYLFIATIISLITGWIFSKLITISPTFYVVHTNSLESVNLVLNNFVNLFLVFLFITFLFLTYKSFMEKYRIWESIGHSMTLIKKYWSRLWKFLLLSTLTITVLTLVIIPLRNLFLSNTFILTVINLIVFLLFLAWFRIYLLKTIGEKV
jgi:hypothetical protein